MTAPSSSAPPVSPEAAVAALWASLDLPANALQRLRLTGAEPVLPSSFAVGTAAQASLAAAALAATEIGIARNGLAQDVAVDMSDAAAETTAWLRIDGRKLEVWDRIAGLYRCRDGWLRLHTNFEHHRDGVLHLLGLPPGPDTSREQVAAAIADRPARAFEDEASAAGLVVAAMRSTPTWQTHPQHLADAAGPLITIERIGDAPPLPWPELAPAARPLTGLRVLDLTRILAGPAGTRTLAAYGADVLLVNSPHLPNIEHIADTSRGKRSAMADLQEAGDRAAFGAVLRDAHVMVQGYRPGGLAALGFGAEDVARLRPGLVHVSLSAYAEGGPWQGRRGFDSLVQTATGLNADEAAAAGVDEPKALPTQILDMATAFLIAFATEAALLRQRHEGGSWHVRLALSRTALWLRSLGRIDDGFGAPALDLPSRSESSSSGFGPLVAIRHAARFGTTPAHYDVPSMPPGSAPLAWR